MWTHNARRVAGRCLAACALVMAGAGCGPPVDPVAQALERAANISGTLPGLARLALRVLSRDAGAVSAASPPEHAADLRRRLAEETQGCSETAVTIDGQVITATFADSGCTVEGVTLLGSVVIKVVAVVPPTVRVTTKDLVVNNEPVWAGFTFTASEPGVLDVDVDIRTEEWREDGKVRITVTPDLPPMLVVGGVMTTTAEGQKDVVTLHDICWTAGDCYPHRGAVQYNDVTVVFTEETRNSGKVLIHAENVDGNTTLPSYLECGG